jgi:GNAT superfamily N-acetyltransferase
MEELFGSESRFLLVRAPIHGLVAFLMFRFERENRENIVYWSVSLLISRWADLNTIINSYDIQLSKPVHRKGLGSILLRQLVRVASRWGMQKITLTVIKGRLACLNHVD